MIKNKTTLQTCTKSKNKIYLDKHIGMTKSSLSKKLPSQEFINYMNEKRVRSGDNKMITHQGMMPIQGKFCIPEDELLSFFDKYDQEIKNGVELSIMEKPYYNMELPIVCDIDLKYELPEGKKKPSRTHNFSTIRSIVKSYKDVYEKNFIFRNKSHRKNCYFVVMQRESPYVTEVKDKKYVKDGIHMMCFGYKAYPDVHLKMREKILKDKNFIETINQLNNLNSLDDVLDRAVIDRNSWMLYGSTKPNKDSYKIAYIFDNELQQVNLHEFKDISFSRYLSYYRNTSHHAVPHFTVRQNMISSLKEIKEEDNKVEIKVIEQMEEEDVDNEKLKKEIEFYVSLIKINKKDREYILEIGECLKNISTKQKVNLIDVWEKLLKSTKFKDEDHIELWEKFTNDEFLGIKTLKYIARKDNQEKYNTYLTHKIRDFLILCINSTHYDVARVLYLLYENDFVCASIKENKWYEFKDHRWKQVESGFSLRRKISKELVNQYKRFQRLCNKLHSEEYKLESSDKKNIDTFGYALDEDFFENIDLDKSEWEENSKKCSDIIKKLKTKSYKDALLSESKDFFYDETFNEHLDERHSLLGCENGVFDFSKKLFRNGRPDDYISMNTKCKYIKNYKRNKDYASLQEFLKQVYLTDDMVHFKLKERAYMLHGDVKEEKIHTNIGKGGNGKSKERELCGAALGDYVFGFPITLFTGKKGASNAASPEVARSKGKRIAFVDEPEQGAKINIGLIKKFSGGDPIETRGLYSDMIEIRPQFKITILCNDFPEWPPHDEGGRRRLLVTEYKARFVDEPKHKNEFKRDRNISSKIKKWAPLYLSMLIDYYYKYEEEGLNPPQEVLKFTHDLIKEGDAYDTFLSDTLDESINKEDFVNVKDLFQKFREWIEENGINPRKNMNFKEFQKYIEKKINKQNAIKKGNLYGFREKLSYN